MMKLPVLTNSSLTSIRCSVSKSTIPLAKTWNQKKITYPCFVSEKIDGVPIRIDINADGAEISYSIRSRQDKPVPSCTKYVEVFIQTLINDGVKLSGCYTFVAEVSHKTLTDFKDVSGVVRRKEHGLDLVLNFFDFHKWSADTSNNFTRRTQTLCAMLSKFENDTSFNYIPQRICNSYAEVVLAIASVYASKDKVEGCVLRNGEAEFAPNTRRWDYQKFLKEPTEDCHVIRYEEAHDKHGDAKGMVGSIIVHYNMVERRVGAGKMTHAERRSEWAKYGADDHLDARLCTIKHKGDNSYDGLRQGTFQHWRPDKTE